MVDPQHPRRPLSPAARRGGLLAPLLVPLVVSLLALLLPLGGCAQPAPAAPREQRWAALREDLRRTMGPAYDAPLPPADPASRAAAAEIWAKSCAACHGLSGAGDGPRAASLRPPPVNLVEGEGATYFSDAAQLRLIEEGVPGTDMPPWKRAFTPEQLRAVYEVLEAQRLMDR